MRGVGDGDRLAGEIQLKLVACFFFVFAVGFRVKIGVHGAGDELRGAELLAIVPKREMGEIDFCVRGETQGAAILEFDFGAAILAGLQLAALDHGQVDERFVKTVSGGAVELHRALHFA